MVASPRHRDDAVRRNFLCPTHRRHRGLLTRSTPRSQISDWLEVPFKESVRQPPSRLLLAQFRSTQFEFVHMHPAGSCWPSPYGRLQEFLNNVAEKPCRVRRSMALSSDTTRVIGRRKGRPPSDTGRSAATSILTPFCPKFEGSASSFVPCDPKPAATRIFMLHFSGGLLALADSAVACCVGRPCGGGPRCAPPRKIEQDVC